jgi:hypothetical protein
LSIIKNKQMKNLVKLNSVGSLFDKESKIVLPQLVSGSYDLSMGTHIDNVSNEWLEKLSKADLILIQNK